jgi:hypothetical protein
VTGDNAFSYAIFQRKIRGTSVVQANDQLGDLIFQGYDGATYRTAAIVRAAVDGTPGASDMPGRLAFLTTPDGAASPTERMRIDSNGLITGTGTSLGAWTSYTPTLGGTGWALGDGTAGGFYCHIGKVVHFRARFTFGSTSTFGAVAPTVSLPVTARSGNENAAQVFAATFRDVSAVARYSGISLMTSTTAVTIYSDASPWAEVTSTVPFTWASTDQILIHGTYEAA